MQQFCGICLQFCELKNIIDTNHELLADSPQTSGKNASNEEPVDKWNAMENIHYIKRQ